MRNIFSCCCIMFIWRAFCIIPTTEKERLFHTVLVTLLRCIVNCIQRILKPTGYHHRTKIEYRVPHAADPRTSKERRTNPSVNYKKEKFKPAREPNSMPHTYLLYCNSPL